MFKLYSGACQFYLGNFNDAVQLALSGPSCSLQSRLLFHCAHKLSDEKMLVENHAKLTGIQTISPFCSVQYLQIPSKINLPWLQSISSEAIIKKPLRSINVFCLNIVNTSPFMSTLLYTITSSTIMMSSHRCPICDSCTKRAISFHR